MALINLKLRRKGESNTLTFNSNHAPYLSKANYIEACQFDFVFLFLCTKEYLLK